MDVEQKRFACFVLWTAAAYKLVLGCDDGWHQFRGHCYLLIDQETLVGGSAAGRKLCRALGADIATIRSLDEQMFVRQLMYDGNNLTTVNNGFYFGVSDALDEGHFTYVDGTELTYSNWRPGEPNNYHGIENCGKFLSGYSEDKPPDMTLSGYWMDIMCHETHPRTDSILCEKLDETYYGSSAGSQSVVFTTIEKSFLIGQVIQGSSVATLFDCLVMCLSNNECLSVNFKRGSHPSELNCELNAISSHEIESNSEWSDVNHPSADRNYSDWDFHEIQHPGF